MPTYLYLHKESDEGFQKKFRRVYELRHVEYSMAFYGIGRANRLVIMRIFLYVFYTLSKIYRAGLDRRDPDVYARGALICFLILNVLTILELVGMDKEQMMLYGGIIIFIILILTFILFNSKTLRKLDERWDKEPKPQRIFRRMLVVLYVVTTAAAFLYVGLR